MGGMSALVMAGDVGGTHARLAVFEVGGDGGPGREAWSGTYPSRDHEGLESIVRAALAESGLRPSALSVGVAGPVVGGQCRTTNLPWLLDERSLALAAGLPSARLLNDVEAAAWGLGCLRDADLLTLHAGIPDAPGSQALLTVGTGLGHALLAWDGQRHVIQASEGGHASLAPRDDEQDALVAFLRSELGHVSWERALSGPGLVNLARFLDASGRAPLPADLRAALGDDGAPAAITAAAAAGVPAARDVLRLFARLLGSEAGNAGLRALATGGVFIGGGIPPRILGALPAGEVVAAFLDKGRMRDLLERMPLRIVLDDRVALRGAARHAMQALPATA